MSFSFTATDSNTFTVTHARHMAAKVATDLKRIQRFYFEPDDARIARLETELVALLKAGFLDYAWYGFQRNGQWIEPTLRYTHRELSGFSSADDDPGRVIPGANVQGASFHSFIATNQTYTNLSATAKALFDATLPISRTPADLAGLSGYMESDRNYSAGGQALSRSTLRSL